MRFTNEVEIKIGDDGLCVLREPTNAEWNSYKSEAINVGRHNRLKDNSETARAGLFDKVCTKISNLSDEKGEIPISELHRIPVRVKSQCIFQAFESVSEEINLKN